MHGTCGYFSRSNVVEKIDMEGVEKKMSFMSPGMKTGRNIMLTLVVLAAIVGLGICLGQKLNVVDQIKKGFTFLGNEFSNFEKSPIAIVSTLLGAAALGLGLRRMYFVHRVNNINGPIRTVYGDLNSRGTMDDESYEGLRILEDPRNQSSTDSK